ncbi:NUDIX hydrolase [Escherichia coli]|nr:NUDIX hydrolase [Escherichia coli]
MAFRLSQTILTTQFLTEEDFKSRIVGSVMLPYIRGDEVWAVCRVYLQSIVEEIAEGDVSTSPSVVFNSTSGNVEVQEGDTNFLIEGVPFLVDHIALVTKDHGSLGVWDKDRIPAGVEVTNTGEIEMEKEELQALLQGVVNDALSGINQKIDGVVTRMDSLEQRDKARADAEELAKKEAEEKAKADEAAAKDAEEKAKADSEAEEQRKADEEAEKERNDSALAEAQAKADSAFSACGKNAPAPFSGENALDYRKRALIAMQKHSPAHKEVNIRAIADSATLAVLEDAIFSAARQSIEKEMMSTQGQLHKRIRNDEAGRRITEYQGDPNVWLSAFKIPGRRLAKINTQGSLNNG